eukprot:gnl/MRDRNA2_/MRDRNA2_84032_c0_seq1.p1 gnl/MRDRNA2_/MRDRNA2_84032_c0~~gnl/MRDRNA2_/MRDRNA2_84032_c0_seq1.p1  ORF type:complete len:545 (+),score=90.09 gnl/MRDRNA2_/MRDRNA2_84032_c0_seq1:178-1812(+)
MPKQATNGNINGVMPKEAFSVTTTTDIEEPEVVHVEVSGSDNVELRHAISRTFLVCLAYLAFTSVSDFKIFVPFDGFFATFLLWAGARVGARASELLGVPRLLGMLCMGIALKNIGDPVRNMPDEWSSAIRSFGLMNILMRGGLEMDFVAVRRLGFAVMRLTVCPGVSEAFTVALVSMVIFGMPFPLGLSLGFILGAVSPAVVVGGMFDLQHRHYGVEKGVPSLVVAAASFDDVVAISGFSLCIGFAIGSGDLASQILHGPLEVILGVGTGFCGAYLCALTKLWDSGEKRIALVVCLGACYMFIFKHLHFAGAGALASLVMAARSAQLWEKGWGGSLSEGPNDHIAHEVEHDLANIWRSICEPLLFSVIGSALDFSALDTSLIPASIGVILCGVSARTLVASFATYGAGLNMKERIFIALAWMPKATVQAALGAVPLEMIRTNFADDPVKLAEYEKLGMSILTTAVFSIIITAPAGLIVIQQLGPRCLEHNPPQLTADGAEQDEPEWCAWGVSCCLDEYSYKDPAKRQSLGRISARHSHAWNLT